MKFRRVARIFHASRLDYADAAELAAFVATVDGVKYARWMFHWKGAGVEQAELLVTHMKQFPEIADMEQANRASLTRDDGLAMLRAMKDGGWRQGSVPGAVRMALLDMRDAGMSQQAVGDAAGLTRDQIRVMTVGMRSVKRGLGIAGLVAG